MYGHEGIEGDRSTCSITGSDPSPCLGSGTAACAACADATHPPICGHQGPRAPSPSGIVLRVCRVVTYDGHQRESLSTPAVFFKGFNQASVEKKKKKYSRIQFELINRTKSPSQMAKKVFFTSPTRHSTVTVSRHRCFFSRAPPFRKRLHNNTVTGCRLEELFHVLGYALAYFPVSGELVRLTLLVVRNTTAGGAAFVFAAFVMPLTIL